MSILGRCPPYTESMKMTEERKGPTLGVHFNEKPKGPTLGVHFSEVSASYRVREYDWRTAGTNTRPPF